MGVDSSASTKSFCLSSSTSPAIASNMTKKSEVHRMVSDISCAITSSALLSLLRDENRDTIPDASSVTSIYECQRHEDPRKRKKHYRYNYDNISPPAKCLTDISQAKLEERIKPIKLALERVDAKKLLGLKLIRSSEEQVMPGPLVEDGVYCRRIDHEIRPRLRMNDDDVKSEDRDSVVRYLHIAEVPNHYTIGIFVFGPNQRIPLHDHPEMCVLSRVLYGDLQRLSLDLDRGHSETGPAPTTPATPTRVENTTNNSTKDMNCAETEIHSPQPLRHFLERQISKNGGGNTMEPEQQELQEQHQSETSSWISRSVTWLRNSLNGSNGESGVSSTGSSDDRKQRFPKGTKIAFKNEIDSLRAPDVASLYPYEGNLHEFVAGPHGAAVLDVLLPPYDDDHERDCTFYHIRDVNSIIYGNTSTTSSTLLSSESSMSSNHSSYSSDATPTLQQSTGNSSRYKDMQNSSGMLLDRGESSTREPCLIIPTGQPENFHCISGTYRNLGDREDNYDFMEDDNKDDGSDDDEELYSDIEP